MRKILLYGGLFAVIFLIVCYWYNWNRTENNKKLIAFDLNEAYNREINSASLYHLYSRLAEKEGNADDIVRLYSALAFAKEVHAKRFKGLLDKLNVQITPRIEDTFIVGSTADNLEKAIETESEKIAGFYPALIEKAKTAGEKSADFSGIATSCIRINESSKTHVEKLKRVSECLRQSHPDHFVFYVCPSCGNIYTDGDPKEQCEVCSTYESSFLEF